MSISVKYGVLVCYQTTDQLDTDMILLFLFFLDPHKIQDLILQHLGPMRVSGG